jgi:hypothetical protein
MTRRFPVLHPILLAAYPVLFALSINLESFNPGEAIRPLCIAVFIATALMLVLKLAIKDWHRAGFLTSLCLLMAFCCGYLNQMPKLINFAGVAVSRRTVFIVFWLLIFGIASSNRLWKKVRPQLITNFMNLLGGILIVFPVSLFIMYAYNVNQDPLTNWTRPVNETEANDRLGGDFRPDIYYIIVDGYGRADVLKELYRFDNSDFIKFLTNRGFYVAGKAHSNYVQTGLSLASSLNFEYLDYLRLGEDKSTNRYLLKDLIVKSRVRLLLKDIGYRTVTVSSGYILTDINDADLYLSLDASFFTKFEGLLLRTSAAQFFVDTRTLEDIINYGYETHRKRVFFAFEQLAKIPVTVPSPKFVFAHIVTPHPPFIFDRSGNPIEPNGTYYIGDGSHFQGTPQDYITGYNEQVLHVNQLLSKTIDAILKNSKKPPIIILQADHGPGMLLNWESDQETCIRERTSILNAYYMPTGGVSNLYSSITPVNSFRVLFDNYFGTHFGMLKDKSYYSPWSQPYKFFEVTIQNDISCNDNNALNN